jgi:hypothetical protein
VILKKKFFSFTVYGLLRIVPLVAVAVVGDYRGQLLCELIVACKTNMPIAIVAILLIATCQAVFEVEQGLS